MTTASGVLQPQHRSDFDVCEHCRWSGSCIPLADLRCLELNRRGLEADYGWDVFSFMAEAKHQYRKARSNGCPQLSEVAGEAKLLAEYVDFENLS